MDANRYQELASRTASPQFHSDKVEASILLAALLEFERAATALEHIKKTLFYGKPLPVEEIHELLLEGIPDAEETKTLLEEFPFACGITDNQLTGNTIVLHGAIGIASEAGEVITNILQSFRTGQYDDTNLLEESGDSFWYHAELHRGLNAPLGETMRANILKLAARYGDKFSSDRAIIRDLENERSILTAAVNPSNEA